MSEHTRLPPGMLPREEQYRPARRGLSALPVIVGIIAFLGLWICGRKYAWALSSWEQAEIVFILVFPVLLARTLWRFRNVNAAIKESQDAAALLEGGKIAEGAAILEALCRRVSPQLPLHAILVHNRGVAYLRAGQPDRALSLFAAVMESGRYEKPKSALNVFYPMLLDAVATAYAVKGETETAEHWQGLAHENVTPARVAMLLPLDVMLGIRAGRNEIVVRDAEALWADAVGCLPGFQMQVLRILCAFALAQVNHQDVYSEKVRMFLEGVKPCRPGQFDCLALKWPELRAFLEAHELSATLESKTTLGEAQRKQPQGSRQK